MVSTAKFQTRSLDSIAVDPLPPDKIETPPTGLTHFADWAHMQAKRAIRAVHDTLGTQQLGNARLHGARRKHIIWQEDKIHANNARQTSKT